MKHRVAVCLIMGLAAPVWANDTTATVGAGGLQFARNENVRMLSEELYLSMEQVGVVYEFENLSDADQHVLVAFPMPDISGDIYGMTGYPTDDPENVFGFSTLFDDRPVAAELHQSVFAMGVDRTKELVGLGLPLAPHVDETQEAINALPAEDKEFLLGIGAIETLEPDGEDTYFFPVWTLKSAYLWEAVFPAGETVTVEHSYTPGLGGTVAATFLDEEYGDRERYEQKYCLEDNIVAAVEAAMTDPAEPWSAPFSEAWLSYVLSTGANWAGSIGTFRLVVDKGSEGNLVSFCGEGVTKTGPTTFEALYEDFHPWEDIEVLFLVRRETH